jgi:GTP-binding protein EngB required for normal cell division
MTSSTDYRTVCHQLAEDLGWLEDHCRGQADLAVHAGQLRLAAGLVRNAVGPYLDKQPAIPLHVAVVGGAGSGKSTVANFLVGAAAAEANPQAGFTRHPVAYVLATANVTWPSQMGFLGPLRKLAEPAPSNLDEDVYQIRRIEPESERGLLTEYVVWDCPDMTTWAATGYVPRLLEVCALADMIVFVASDERYNDEVPTQFLELLLRAGKPVVICLTKMQEDQAPAMLEHFRREVLARMPKSDLPVVAIPFLSAEELADPVHRSARFRTPLVNQVSALCGTGDKARRRTVKQAADYLSASIDGLLAVARSDMQALEVWKSLVTSAQANFDARYYNEYLISEKFQRFDEAMVKLVDLLELPGVGKIVSGTLYVVRTPYRLLKGWVQKLFARPEAAAVPERPMLEGALQAWLDQLRAEALRRVGMHPLWTHVNKGFDGALPDGARARFEEKFREFQLGLAGEVERTSRAIYEDLQKKPALLNTLRGGKLALDVAGIASSIALLPAGHLVWAVVAVPLAASATQMLVEAFGKTYVESQREQTRRRQQDLARQYISAPLAEWLIQWPISGGSSFERLQQALRRIPESIGKVKEMVEQS